MPDKTQTASVRLRKAWLVTVKGYDDSAIVYAPTAGRARVEIWRSLETGQSIIDVVARRAQGNDVTLPSPDPIAAELSLDERDCLLHAFGITSGDVNKAGYRDYFYTRRDDPPLVALTERGLMEPMEGDKFGEGMTYFVLTPSGRHAALSLTPEYNR